MLIFNITFLVSVNASEKWLKWVKAEHIPFMIATGYFSKPQLAKVLNDHGQDGTSYSVQYHIAGTADLNEWHRLYAEKMQQDCTASFGQEVLFFTTALELLP
jgi:hypothetical protein